MFPPPGSSLQPRPRPPCFAQGWALPARPVLCAALPHICPRPQPFVTALGPPAARRGASRPAVVWGRGRAARHVWERHRGRSVSPQNGRVNGAAARSRYRRSAAPCAGLCAARPAVWGACRVSLLCRRPRAAVGLPVAALLLRSRLPAPRFPNGARGRAAPRPPAAVGRLLRADTKPTRPTAAAPRAPRSGRPAATPPRSSLVPAGSRGRPGPAPSRRQPMATRGRPRVRRRRRGGVPASARTPRDGRGARPRRAAGCDWVGAGPALGGSVRAARLGGERSGAAGEGRRGRRGSRWGCVAGTAAAGLGGWGGVNDAVPGGGGRRQVRPGGSALSPRGGWARPRGDRSAVGPPGAVSSAMNPAPGRAPRPAANRGPGAVEGGGAPVADSRGGGAVAGRPRRERWERGRAGSRAGSSARVRGAGSFPAPRGRAARRAGAGIVAAGRSEGGAGGPGPADAAAVGALKSLAPLLGPPHRARLAPRLDPFCGLTAGSIAGCGELSRLPVSRAVLPRHRGARQEAAPRRAPPVREGRVLRAGAVPSRSPRPRNRSLLCRAVPVPLGLFPSELCALGDARRGAERGAFGSGVAV